MQLLVITNGYIGTIYKLLCTMLLSVIYPKHPDNLVLITISSKVYFEAGKAMGFLKLIIYSAKYKVFNL